MDPVPAVMIFAHILYPTSKAFQINPVHFGVVMVVSLCIGLITPPVGMNLFVASSVGNSPVHKIVKHIIPFIIATLIQFSYNYSSSWNINIFTIISKMIN